MAETHLAPGDSTLATRFDQEIEGEVCFDPFTRGLYSTDASHYQIEPLGVVFPRSVSDVEAVIGIARGEGVPILPRGGGTSQCGQTIGRAVILDTSRHLTGIGDPDRNGHVEVEPGVVLDNLNARLGRSGSWFPVDPSTSSRATLGGMAGNNTAGSRSLKYGMMVDNVAAVEVVLPDGRRLWLGEGGTEAEIIPDELTALRALYAREASEIQRTTPQTMRNVAGYNLDRLRPDQESLARLFVGSEGTLAFFSRLRLELAPLPSRRVLGVCHFAGLHEALDSVQQIVKLEPSAVELVDRSVLELASQRPDFKASIDRFVRGVPGALLLVEFSGNSETSDLHERLDHLDDLLGDLGYPDSLVRVENTAGQAEVWRVRKTGLSLVMSMAGPRRPISFIEDCAVPLEHLAEYARRVDDIFAQHDSKGTWYAHASVGCLHVRPALNLKDPEDVARVRLIAESVHEVVSELQGTHSGEHGDGILRSEFLRSMLGDRMVAAFEEVKRTFDPHGIMNPGKIVDPPLMDDRSLFRFKPGYTERELPVVLDWSSQGGLLRAVERCDNNGACRKSKPDVMCPSFRVTKDERHTTRGRANALRLALTGQLGDDGLDSPDMAEAMSLCISCKGCRRECPTGVDMARMKLEWQHRQNKLRGVPLRERMLASIPRMAPQLQRVASFLNFGSRTPATRILGLAPKRRLPRWSSDAWSPRELPKQEAPDVVLLVDTFTRWFEPENARAARQLLEAGGWSVGAVEPDRGRPYCCGRTYLSAGMLDEAAEEAQRTLAALAPIARRGSWIVGLEPSCLYTLRDEFQALLPGEDARVVAERAVLLDEFLDREWVEGRELPFSSKSDNDQSVFVHGHCHQKAFGGMHASLSMLERAGRIPNLIESSCCGMAGAFGYHTEHYETSIQMGELSLFPAVRETPPDALIVANGTSCRAQIQDGTDRASVHTAVVLAEALEYRP